MKKRILSILAASLLSGCAGHINKQEEQLGYAEMQQCKTSANPDKNYYLAQASCNMEHALPHLKKANEDLGMAYQEIFAFMQMVGSKMQNGEVTKAEADGYVMMYSTKTMNEFAQIQKAQEARRSAALGALGAQMMQSGQPRAQCYTNPNGNGFTTDCY